MLPYFPGKIKKLHQGSKKKIRKGKGEARSSEEKKL
jgi:hypothetical protein